jgi:3-oxoadipate enol-lactonase
MSSTVASSEPIYFRDCGSGPPLLLIHGLMVSGEMFQPVVDHLAARHRLIIPDLRGYGLSRNLPPPYTAAQLAADLARLLDALDIASTAVLGYSHGGAIAQQFAVDYPARCDRLMLCCTYAFNMTTARERVEGRLLPLLVWLLGPKRIARLMMSAGAKHMNQQQAEWLAGLMADQDRNLMVTACREAMAFDGRQRLSEIRCPTLIVAGSNDTAVPIHHRNTLHHGIAGSRLVVMEGSDHTLIWTRTPEFLRVIDDFCSA